MKKILTTTIFFLFLFLLHTSTSFAATYYISSTDGDDTCTGLSQSPYTTGLTACPIKTLTKLNTKTFSPGDSILFKKGDTFYGSITVSQSGTAGNPITFSSYGSGEKPIITGFTDVTSWTNLGNNIWESTSPVSTLSTLNMVTVNNVNTAMGRWPNADAGNGGYATLESHSGSTSITDNQLTSTPNWAGADIINRVALYILNRSTITNHTNSTLTFSPATTYAPKDGWGYFIENSLSTLDQQNEWYYNPITKKLSIYSASQPQNIKIASSGNLFTVHGSYITIDGLSFSGANNNAIYNEVDNTYRNLIVQDSDISFSGESGIKLKMLDASILNNTIIDSQSNGIEFPYQTHTDSVNITGNSITNTGQLPGMSISNSEGNILNGILVNDKTNGTIEYNSVINSGYNGIKVNGSYNTIRNNFIDTFCNVVDDGGGIYTYNSSHDFITENIIMNGIGQNYGANTSTTNRAEGIYLDYLTSYHEVSYNTTTTSRIGIFTHGTNLNIHHNTSYNNRTHQMIEYDEVGGIDAVNNVINNNLFISKSSTQKAIEIDYPLGKTSSIGTVDYNYYARPIVQTDVIRVWEIGVGATNYTLAQWQTLLGKDANSHISPVSISSESDIFFDYNATQSSKTVSLPWPVVDMDGNKVTGNVTILPYRSVIYLKDPSPNTVDSLPPSISSFTIPTTSTSLAISITTLSATDSTGVTGYLLNETGSTPSAGSGPWSSTPPTSYTFTTQGTKTLYAFAKDLAGNVSLSSSDTITITLPVVTPPAGGGGGGGAPSTTTITCPTGTTLVNTTCVTNTTTSATLIDKAKQKDIKPDGSINIIDFNIIMANWNKTYTKDISLTKGDITGDGLINIFDMNQLMVMWGVRY